MTVTPTSLTRSAGAAAAVAGLLFIGVQVNHPHLDATFATTTEFAVRQTVKVLFTTLSLIGITGMYLSQVRKNGVLGLIGYVLFGAGLLAVLSIEVVGVAVLPALAAGAPGYVNDVLAVAYGGTATGDIGLLQTVNLVGGLTFLVGGFVFGIALFRAGVLARWAAALLAVGTVATVAKSVVPGISPRLFAIPIGVALVGLGYSLWREHTTPAARPRPTAVGSPLDPAGAR